MNTDYVFLCGVMWRNYGSDDARRELIRGLQSGDPDVIALASALLDEQLGVAHDAASPDGQRSSYGLHERSIGHFRGSNSFLA